MEKSNHILSEFSPICLEEMDCVELMNRTDTKFIFPVTHLEELLEKALPHYRILEIGTYRNFMYTNTYLDTNEHLFYEQHLRGKLNRHKVRYRVYDNTGASYLEIKYKTNQLRTVKWRIKSKIENHTGHDVAGFLSKHLPNDVVILNPVIINRFKRITLVNLEKNERVTIDSHISFNNLKDKNVDLHYMAIAELKREGYANCSPFLSIVRDLNIKSAGFSKYCMGFALLHNTPRMNILKPKMLLLQKLNNGYNV
jgi:hypothetical protein